MHTNEPREIEGVELGYDPRDVNTKALGKAVLAFFAFTLIFFGVAAYVFTRTKWAPTTRFDPRKPEFAGPKVQGNVTAKVDIMQMRQAETHFMTTYGVENGKQRIPVDRAIDLLSERGLPAVTSDVPADSPGTTIKQNAVGLGTAPSERAPVSPAPIAP